MRNLCVLSSWLLAMVPWAAAGSETLDVAAGPRQPHILIILADDLGWRDVSYHGAEYPTPNIDRIAREGIELDRFYVQPSCSPTRAGLMTGKSPARLGITRPIGKNEVGGLPLDEKLLPEYLGDQGYQTALIGKWHLGHHQPKQFPQARGFDNFYGNVTGGVGYWNRVHGGAVDWQRDGETLREEGYTTELIGNEAIRWMRARDPSRPTFVMASFTAPHLPNEAPQSTLSELQSIESTNRRAHAAMVTELDRTIGRLLAAYEAEGLLDNTLVLFSSDNGGLNPTVSENTTVRSVIDGAVWLFGRPIPIPGFEFMALNQYDGGADNAPLPRGKMYVDEGGARVPAALWWPGVLEGGKVEHFMTISDIAPTLLDAVGARIPADFDGASQLEVLRDRQARPVKDYVTVGMFGGEAIYRWPWKLVLRGDDPELFNVQVDPEERENRAAEEPELVAAMLQALQEWPRAEPLVYPLRHILFDPDWFGGPEDGRPPWADAAAARAGET